MRFEILGFAGAAPLVGACSSYLVQEDDTTVLLDCGPGTVERLFARALVGSVDEVVVSHMHLDHVLDLPLLSGEVGRVLRDGRPLRLNLPAGGREVLRRLDAALRPQPDSAERFARAFDIVERPRARPVATAAGALRLTFAASRHPQPCDAVRVQATGGGTLVYGADGGPSGEVERLAAGADLLLLEATFVTDSEAAAAHGHMTARQAGELAARAEARELVLTHLLPEAAPEELSNAAAEAFDGPLAVASEGFTRVA